MKKVDDKEVPVVNDAVQAYLVLSLIGAHYQQKVVTSNPGTQL
jgi:hypothetical protein